MVATRKTIRELSDARNSERREAMEIAIAEGRLIVRQMTPAERKQADRDRALGEPARTAWAAQRAARRVR